MVHYMVGIVKDKKKSADSLLDGAGEFFFDAGFKGIVKVDTQKKKTILPETKGKTDVLNEAINKYLLNKGEAKTPDGGKGSESAVKAPELVVSQTTTESSGQLSAYSTVELVRTTEKSAATTRPAPTATTADPEGEAAGGKASSNESKPQGSSSSGKVKGKGKSVPLMTANGLVNVTIYEEDVEYNLNGEVKNKEARTASLTLDENNSTDVAKAGKNTTAGAAGGKSTEAKEQGKIDSGKAAAEKGHTKKGGGKVKAKGRDYAEAGGKGGEEEAADDKESKESKEEEEEDFSIETIEDKDMFTKEEVKKP